MFKRSRDGGPVATQLKRQCLTFTPMPTVAPTPSLKRKREHIDLLPVQRLKSTETSIIGRKRTAAFDDELKHLEKRMRASVPTAEEAIAFLLPHLFSLRTLYNESQHKVDELSRNNLLLQKTCTRPKKTGASTCARSMHGAAPQNSCRAAGHKTSSRSASCLTAK